MKIIPVYLPQFHRIPENDKWWGEGFTEWTNVKNAQPLFEGHYQPRVPLHHNYYDLTDVEVLKWQAKIAREHGIYGFSMYHYWFNGRLLLQKPMELLLAHPEIDLHYCICWANHDWIDSWKTTDKKVSRILISHNFDDEQDWIEHFNYMLPFFKDPRYINENNKPYLGIYIPNIISKLNKMLCLWTKMAQEAGFAGLTYFYQAAPSCFDKSWDRSHFDYGMHFHPGYARMVDEFSGFKTLKWQLIKFLRPVKRILHINTSSCGNKGEILDYDKLWEKILQLRPDDDKTIPGAFVDWDNTPRRSGRGTVYFGASPQKFKRYFRQLVLNTRKYYKQDKIFVFAWNEWGEGGYLEPDEKFGYGYLEAIRDVLMEMDELE